MSKKKKTEPKIVEKGKSFINWLFEKSPEQFKEGLDRLEKVLQVAKGRIDIKSRLSLLLNPDLPQTTTYLTKAQAHFVTTAHFVGKEFPVFQPLSDYAREMELSLISVEGRGVENSVRLIQALELQKIMEKSGVQVKKESEK